MFFSYKGMSLPSSNQHVNSFRCCLSKIPERNNTEKIACRLVNEVNIARIVKKENISLSVPGFQL